MVYDCRKCLHFKICKQYADDVRGEYEDERLFDDCEDFKDAADVAPKSEVERSQMLLKDAYKRIEELDKLCGDLQDEAARYKRYYFNHEYDKLEAEAKSEFAWEIFDKVDEIGYRYLNDADYSGGDMLYDLNELKKKYTEEKT